MKWRVAATCGLALGVSLVCAAQETAVGTDVATEAEVAQHSALLTNFTLAKNEAVPEAVAALLKKYLTVLNRPAQPASDADLQLLRFSVSREVIDLLATEGYFSPQIDFASHISAHNNQVEILLQPGPLTRTNNVALNFTGTAVPLTLQDKIRSSWGLPKGQK